MKCSILQITLLLLFLSGSAVAQLSPGDLSNAHKNLEGITNCTQCHVIGSKVSNDKCLNCHKEIKFKISQNQGYHVSRDVKGKECAKCHSDHHGRNFDMVRFDEKKFDHNLTGYELSGAHKKVDCRKCHQPEYVADLNLKKRKETFLGLGEQCFSCHKDVHQKTLGNDCTKCHTTDAFKPASKFNHDKTDYALEGKHKTVACIECHQKDTRNGDSYQHFSGITFVNCNNCHKDPHKNNLGNNCKECHSEQSFTFLAGLIKFNHSKTPFPLKGKHSKVNCKECHQLEATPLTVFQDRLGVQTQFCSTCHKDVHEGKFGSVCADCHDENGFRKVGNLDVFDHNRTDFALKGKHATVDCKKCHTSASMTDPLPHSNCASCHQDFHEGQFVLNTRAPDCSVCHTVDGFEGSSFSLEQHAITKFPLEGAHVATPCFACHKVEDKWKFRGLGERCVDCHKDIHAGQIAEKWYPNQTCTMCHSTSSWRDNHFDHSKADFKLLGAHAKQNCRDCHKPEPDFQYGKFEGLAVACTSCHEDPHNHQFEKNGVTDCVKCHGFDAWTIRKFDHNKTKFKLDGKHSKVGCAKCHKETKQEEITFVQYKFPNTECVVCHQ